MEVTSTKPTTPSAKAAEDEPATPSIAEQTSPVLVDKSPVGEKVKSNENESSSRPGQGDGIDNDIKVEAKDSNINTQSELPKAESICSKSPSPKQSKLKRVKSDSDIEILSSDNDEDPQSQDDALPSSQERADSEEIEDVVEEDSEGEMGSESDGDIVKLDYAKINSDDSEDDEEDSESDVVLSQESDIALSQDSVKSVEDKTTRKSANVPSTSKTQKVNDRKANKAPSKTHRTVVWKLKTRSIKTLNKRMQIMDENNDTNNDQDKSDLKTLEQSPTQPDGETQKIILAQLKEQFYQQQTAKLKAEPEVKSTVVLDDSVTKSEENKNGVVNDEEIIDEDEEEEIEEEEDEEDELTAVNGTAGSDKQSNSDDSLKNSQDNDEEPMQIDLSSSAEESETVVEESRPPVVVEVELPKPVEEEKDHNHIDFEDLLDNTPQLLLSQSEQEKENEKVLPLIDQCDKSPKNTIAPTTSTPNRTPPPASEVATIKEPESPTSQIVVEKPTALLKVCKVEDVEDVEATEEPPRKPEPSSRSRKRVLSLGSDIADEEVVPSKKLKAELDANFGAHDRLLREYIQQSTNNSTHLEEIQAHANILQQEIQQLNELVRIKEMEWNNMVHLKKVKEEILLRLNRKVNVLELMTSKVGSGDNNNEDAGAANPLITNLLSQPFQKHANRDSLGSLNNTMIPLIASTPSNSAIASGGGGFGLAAMEAAVAAATGNSVPFTSASSTAAILQGRAAMKSSDLAKEKINAAKVHRNILPKPTLPNHQQILNNLAMSAAQSSAAAAAAASGGNATQEKSQAATVAALNAYHAQLNSLQNQVDLLNGHGTSGNSTLTQQQQQNFYNSQIQMGRQGVIKDVKSIIADYRQKHPENVPRRGRRLKGVLGNGIGQQVGMDSKRLSELGLLLSGMDGNSRPSSTESMHSNSNNSPFTTTTTTAAASSVNNTAMTIESIKDVLAQFATLSQNERNLISSVAASMPGTTSTSTTANFLAGLNLSSALTTTSSAGINNSILTGNKAPPPSYPEVTLHPVGASGSNFLSGGLDIKPNTNNNKLNVNNNNLGTSTSNSLLHGILTKSQTRTNTNFTTSFSPTLARLLTAPERISPQHTTNLNAFHQSTSAITPTSNPILGGNSASSAMSAALAAASAGLNLSKIGQQNSEITITPVMSAAAAAAAAAAGATASGLQMTLLQQQLQQQNRLKQEPFLNMDEEDSADRLVIDESSFNDQHQHGQGAQEFQENDVPECQGCKKREAQFVCAGCGNQWYCSRECQVTAWDDHSEVCTG